MKSGKDNSLFSCSDENGIILIFQNYLENSGSFEQTWDQLVRSRWDHAPYDLDGYEFRRDLPMIVAMIY